MTPLAAALTRVSPARRGALRILFGTALGQLIALLAAPLLSRIYTPSDFGLFTVVSAVALTLATIFALRLELAIPLPKSDTAAYSVAALAFAAIGAMTLVSLAALLVFGNAIANSVGQSELMPWLLLTPVVAATMSSFLVLNQLAIRAERYAAISRRNVVASAASVGSQVVLGLSGQRAGGLVLGMALGHAAGAATLIRGAGLRTRAARRSHGRQRLLAALRRYRRFPLVLAPSGLLNSLGPHLPVVLVAYWYGSEVAGWLGLTQRVLFLPVMLVGTAVAQVYLAELAKAARTSPARAATLFARASARLLLVGLAVAIPLLVFGPHLFALIFGPDWLPSGQYAQAMAVALAVQIVASPLSQTLVVFEAQLTQACWDVGRLTATAGAVAVCAALGQPALTAIWAFSAASALAFAVSWLLSHLRLRRVHSITA